MQEQVTMQNFSNEKSEYFNFQKTKTEVVKEGKIFTYEEHSYIAPDKKEHCYDIIKHNGAVAVVTLVNGKIILTKQFRPAANGVVYEIPAGKIEIDEEPMECAKRELLEETGLLAKKLTKISSFYSAIGFCTEIIHLYYVDEVFNALQQLDDDEFIEVYKFSIDELTEMIEQGEIIDSKTILAVYMVKNLIIEGKL